MQPIENKIISRVYSHGRGWALTKTDFAAEFGEDNIHQALSSLCKAGRIRRVCRGVYDYPPYSDLLQQPLSPDIDQVAHALGRRLNWRIQPSGDAALNMLGLSTQVPGRWVYLSDGPTREYAIGKTLLVFKQTALKEVGFKHPKSGLLVHSLKTLGQDRDRIPRDTRQITGWVHHLIKQICQEAD